jgi:hypothetical protein
MLETAGTPRLILEDYRHVTTCAIVRDIQEGVGLNWAAFIQLGSYVSSSTLVSKLRMESVVGGVANLLAAGLRRQCSMWTRAEAMGSAR